ncbi:MAG: hypothetical protein AAF589_02150 [Planctomycetota bacterium]
MISYANHEFAYDSERDFSDDVAEETAPRKKDYSRNRSYKTARSRPKRRSNQPGCGISARRNRRYSA